MSKSAEVLEAQRRRAEARMDVAGLLVGLLVAASLTGCGGGGGGGTGGGGGSTPPPLPTVTGTGFAPTSGPGDTQGYLPLAAGNQWVYVATNAATAGAAMSGELTATISGTTSILNTTATVLRQNDTTAAGPVDQYYSSVGGGVTYLGNNDPTDLLTAQIVPYVQLRFPVQTGAISNVAGQNLPFGKDSSGNPLTLNFTQTIVNQDFEAVSVPAASFATAIKQVTTVTGTALDAGKSIAVSGTDTAWFVAGIGLVKETTTAAVAGMTTTHSSELRGFIVNGRAGGFGTPFAVTPVADTTLALGATIASDGTNFLVVALQSAGMNGTTAAWVATLLAADGTLMQTINLTAPALLANIGNARQAAASFDGTNYLVVYSLAQATAGDLLMAVSLSANGTIVNGPVAVTTLAIQNAGRDITLGFDGAHYLLVYSQILPTGFGQLSGLLLDPATLQATTGPFLIAPASGDQENPAVAFDGTQYLVAWDEFSGAFSPLGLNATRVTTAGVALDNAPAVLICSTAALIGSAEPTFPAVLFDGTHFLVAYRDSRAYFSSNPNYSTVSAARISSAGILMDGTSTTPGIVVSSTPYVATGGVGGAFLVGASWLTWPQGSVMYGARVSPDGSVSSPGTGGFPLYASGANGDPIMGANGRSALWVWLTASGLPPVTPVVRGQALFPVGP